MSLDQKVGTYSDIDGTNITDGAELDLKYFSRFFGTLPDPVVMTDSQQRVVFLNHAAEELLGCSVHPDNHCPPWQEILQIDSEKQQRLVEQCFTGSNLRTGCRFSCAVVQAKSSLCGLRPR